jgi:PTS system cellobiose-specific IIB component
MNAIGIDRLENNIADYDVILVGPQLGHKYDMVKAKADELNKPSILLTSEIYGAMDGATVVKQALIAYRKQQAQK